MRGRDKVGSVWARERTYLDLATEPWGDQMPVRKSFLLGAAVGVTSVVLSAPAGASATSSIATLREAPANTDPAQKYVYVLARPSLGDTTSRALTVRYEGGSFVFIDSGGIVPRGTGCVADGLRAVRCPIDLNDPAIAGMSFDVETGGGDDRIDLRGMPDLPGGELTQSTEVLFDGPARPHFLAGGGDDVVLSGAYGSDGDLGPGADLFRGGSGSDGTAFVGEFGHLSGGRGSDRLIGGPGNDKLSGDLGNDFLKGDAGHDILVGGLGNDRLHSRDGEVDWVACGPGKRSRQPIRPDRIDKRLRHGGKLAHYGCISKD